MNKFRSTFSVSLYSNVHRKIFSPRRVSVLLAILFCELLISSSHAQTIKSETFGSWSVSCGPQNCAMTQLVAKDEAAKQVMLGVSINYAFASEYGALMVRLPAGINKQSGIGIKVDDYPAIQLGISQCNSSACQSIIKIDHKLLKEFSTGKVAKFAYVTQNQQIILPISLNQFEHAYASLSAQNLRRKQQ